MQVLTLCRVATLLGALLHWAVYVSMQIRKGYGQGLHSHILTFPPLQSRTDQATMHCADSKPQTLSSQNTWEDPELASNSPRARAMVP